MDRANSHTKSYNIPRSFEAMYINIKYELRAWLTCDAPPYHLEPLSPVLCLGVNPFPSRFIYRTALRGGFARTQFKDPIKTELEGVYCLRHIPI